mgnify:CR=1 FL=1
MSENKTKLGQEPIVPTVFRQIGENQFRTSTEKDLKDNFATLKHTEGMSKRFYAACAAMQGLVAHYGLAYSEQHAKESYKLADELLKQENAE